MKTKFFVAICLLVFLTAAVLNPLVCAQSGAQNAINSAKSTINSCYEAVKEAEAAGANVEGLTSTLNNASSLLSNAELAYAAQNFDAAVDYATQSRNMLNGFVAEAEAQRDAAAHDDGQSFLVMAISSVASLALLFSGVAAWVILGRKHGRTIDGTATV